MFTTRSVRLKEEGDLVLGLRKLLLDLAHEILLLRDLSRGSGFEVWGLGFGVWGLGFGVLGFEFSVLNPLRVWG